MALDPRRKPTDREFQDFMLYQKKTWDSPEAVMRKVQQYYFGTADIWEDFYRRNPLVAPNSRPPFNSSLFASRVDQAVASMAFEPKITRRPVGEGTGHQKHADDLEEGMQALVHDSFSQVTNFPSKLASKNLVLFDYTPAMVMLNTTGMERPKERDGEKKEDFEEREWEWMSTQQHWNPIKISIPTPGEVLMDPFDTNPPVSVWKQSATAWDLAETIMNAERRHSTFRGIYPQFDDAFTRKFSFADPYEEKDFIHWYTARWHGIYLKTGENLLWEPNMMGIQPFSHVWAGDVISPVGEKFDLANWVRQAMMYRIIDEVIFDSQAVVINQNLMGRHGFSRLVYGGNAAELAEGLRFGIIKADPKDISLEPLPPMLPQFFAQQEHLEAGIDRHTYSPLEAGYSDLRTETATGAAIRAEHSSRTFTSIRAKMEHLFANVVGNGAKIIYHSHKVLDDEGAKSSLFKEIGVGEAKVRVRDMEEQFHFQVSFAQTDIASHIQAVEEAKGLVEMGAAGFKYLRKVVGIENEKEAEDDVLDTMLQRDPEFLQEMLIQVARKKGLDEYADKKEIELKAMRLQRMQQEAEANAPMGANGNVPQR